MKAIKIKLHDLFYQNNPLIRLNIIIYYGFKLINKRNLISMFRV
jgi:hypothetical protein